ncbi:MAG: DUF5916 domain-containing protein [Vicinamibacteria bacterium]
MIATCLLLAAAVATADATPDALPAPASYSGRQGQLQVPLPRLEEEIEIDGALDEAAWTRAARLTEFSQYSPVDGRPADERTEVLVYYSPTAILFGVRAWAAPGSVRASLANRDRLQSEDSVSIFLSTFDDGRQALVFTVNPLGVQADGALVEGATQNGGGFSGLATTRESEDLSPDFVFQSKGRLLEDGYAVELRIPFKSLRYQSGEVQSWGLHVVRKVQSTGYELSWAPARRNAASFLGQAGRLEGLRELRPGLVLDLTPVVTARLDGAPSAPAGTGWEYHAPRPEPGGNVRWGVTPNLALNGTVNPDFSQVEADAGQFVYDPRQAVFFPEKRPFFLDGLEQFQAPNRLVYTRRVVAPVGAVKLTGKASGFNIGLLSAVDDAEASRNDAHPFVNVLRLQRDLRGQSKLGLVYTDRIDGDDYNRVAGLDTRLAFGGIYTLQLQGALSRTARGGSVTTAPLWEGSFNRNGRRQGLRALITGIDEDFRAETGFISRPGIVRANVDNRLSFFGPDGGLVEVLNCDVVAEGVWRYASFVGEGGVQDQKLHFNNNATLRGGWKLGASLLVEQFGYDAGFYEDYALQGDAPGELLPFVGVPTIDNLDWVLSFETPQFQKLSATAQWLFGRDENFFEWAPADITYLTLTLDWRPAEKLRVNAEYRLQDFQRRSDGSRVGRRQLPRLKLEYQATRAIFLRFVAEYDARMRDALRDDSRTERPILIRDEATGAYQPALATRDNGLRLDVLFSWQPNPGTVFFAGYGSSLRETDSLRFRDLQRTSDGFFVKLSYLFRL